MEFITSFDGNGWFTGLERSIGHTNLPSAWRRTWLSETNLSPCVFKTCTQMSLPFASTSKIPNYVLNKSDVTIQHAAKSQLLDGVTKPKLCQAIKILLELFYLLDLRCQVCRNSHVQVLQRGMNCKGLRHHLKNQVANKTQSTLKLLSRNIHFTAISAVSDNCLRIQK